MKYLIKIDRIAAWVLITTMFLYFVSGYGMTKGLIDASWAVKLHNNWLPVILLTAFTLHTSFAIHLALKRWRLWNVFTKVLLIAFYTLFVIGFLYVEFLYHKVSDNSATQNTGTSQTNQVSTSLDDDEGAISQNTGTATTPTQGAASSTVKAFTVAELAKYNGKNGQPAYAAVDGNVYDLTKVFPNGFHYSHFAGKDLTNEFYSEHAKSKLSKYPIIGKLQ